MLVPQSASPLMQDFLVCLSWNLLNLLVYCQLRAEVQWLLLEYILYCILELLLIGLLHLTFNSIFFDFALAAANFHLLL